MNPWREEVTFRSQQRAQGWNTAMNTARCDGNSWRHFIRSLQLPVAFWKCLLALASIRKAIWYSIFCLYPLDQSTLPFSHAPNLGDLCWADLQIHSTAEVWPFVETATDQRRWHTLGRNYPWLFPSPSQLPTAPARPAHSSSVVWGSDPRPVLGCSGCGWLRPGGRQPWWTSPTAPQAVPSGSVSADSSPAGILMLQ